MQEINLYDLLKYYAKNWLILLSAIFAGAIIGLVYTSYIQNPSYRSNATLFIVNNDQTAISKDSTLINNYLELIKSRRVLEPVISELNLNKDYNQITGSVSADNQKDTAIIKLAVVSDSPDTSRDIANSTTASFRKQIKDLYGKENIQVVDSASLATAPYNVRKSLQLAVATTAGLLIASVAVFFMYDYRLNNGTLNKKKISKPKAVKTESVKKPVKAKTTSSKKKISSLKARISKLLGKNTATPAKKKPAVKKAKTSATRKAKKK